LNKNKKKSNNIISRMECLKVLAFIVFAQIALSNAQTTWVSWIMKGKSVANNTVLTYNVGDSFTMKCLSDQRLIGAITKSSTPPVATMFSLNMDSVNLGNYLFAVSGTTLIYDDINGPAGDYEYYGFFGSGYSAYSAGGYFLTWKIAILLGNDAGTYFCSGHNKQTTASLVVVYSSGALTIQVNTKVGQSLSSASRNKMLQYSFLLSSAVKLLL
jgi:hypothetical protein